MKKILIMFLICMLCIPVNIVFADSFNAVVESKTASNGDTVEINISFENNSGIVAALFNVEYDKERLSLIEVYDGKLLESGTFSQHYSDYPYKMVWNSASTENFYNDGILVTMKFEVLKTAKSGKAYINLTYDEDNVFDVDLNNVKINVINGGIDVKSTDDVQKDSTDNISEGKYSSTKEETKSSITIKKEAPEQEKQKNQTTEEPKNPFTDVKGAEWFAENVKYVFENGLMNGVTSTEFAPNDNLTRAMLVAILYRAEGEPETNTSIPFADVKADDYFANAVIWAQQNGIVKGVSKNEFAPNEKITREQIAAIIYRYANYKGYDTSAKADISAYADYNEISEYAVEAMQYAVGSDLIKGKTETTLNPKDNATRAEIAAILQRFIEGNK